MSKAEEMAWMAFPENVVIDSSGESTGVDFNLLPRNCFRKGYEQAEKDLAVTWEDVKAITTIADSLLTGTAWDAVDWPDEQKYYEEVLKRFKEAKK